MNNLKYYNLKKVLEERARERIREYYSATMAEGENSVKRHTHTHIHHRNQPKQKTLTQTRRTMNEDEKIIFLVRLARSHAFSPIFFCENNKCTLPNYSDTKTE